MKKILLSFLILLATLSTVTVDNKVSANDEKEEAIPKEESTGHLPNYSEMYGMEPVQHNKKKKMVKGRSATPTELSYIAIFVEFPNMETVDLDHENAVKVAKMVLNDGGTAIAAGGVKKPIQSLNQYIKKYSYNTMNVTGGVYPQNERGEVVSYVTPQSREYYKPYHSTTNVIGYKNLTEKWNREKELIRGALEAAKTSIEKSVTGKQLDADNDGFIDTISFFVEAPSVIESGDVAWGDLLWSHKTSVNANTVINGKGINEYNLINTFDPAGPGGVFSYSKTGNETVANRINYSVIHHEYLHILSLPDLYRGTTAGRPVAFYDIMAENNGGNPQGLLGATKEWLEWTPPLEEITTSTQVTIKRPKYIDKNEKYGVKIKSPFKDDEYIVAEFYEKQQGEQVRFTGREDGLLLYRIKKGYYTNMDASADGSQDFIFVYRPGETVLGQAEGDLHNAVVSPSVGTAYGRTYQENPTGWDANALYYSDGSNSGIKVDVASSTEDTITLNITVPTTKVEDKGATSVALSETNISMQRGQKKSLQANVLPESAVDKTITWKSSNTAIASVDSNGQVIAKKAGNAQITGTTTNGLAASTNVTVAAEMDVVYVNVLNNGPTSLGTKEDPLDEETALQLVKDGGIIRIVKSITFDGYGENAGEPKQIFPKKKLIIEGETNTSIFVFRYSLVINGDITFRNVGFDSPSLDDAGRQVYLNGHNLTMQNVTQGVAASHPISMPSIIAGSNNTDPITLSKEQVIYMDSCNFNGIYASGKGETIGNVKVVLEKTASQNQSAVSTPPRGLYAGGFSSNGHVTGEVLFDISSRSASTIMNIDGTQATKTSLIIRDGAMVDTAKTRIKGVKKLALEYSVLKNSTSIEGLEDVNLSDGTLNLENPLLIKNTFSGSGNIDFYANGRQQLEILGKSSGNFIVSFQNKAPIEGTYIKAPLGSTVAFTYNHSNILMTGASLEKEVGSEILWKAKNYTRALTSISMTTNNFGENNVLKLVGGLNSKENREVIVNSIDQKGITYFNPGVGLTKEHIKINNNPTTIFDDIDSFNRYVISKNSTTRIQAGKVNASVEIPGKSLVANIDLTFMDTPEMELTTSNTNPTVNENITIDLTLTGAQKYSGKIVFANKDRSIVYGETTFNDKEELQMDVILTGIGNHDLYAYYEPSDVSNYYSSRSGKLSLEVATMTNPITGITLNKTAISMNKGSTYTLVPTITPSTTTDSKKVTWTSSNASVATVDSNGKVTATGNGSVEISATTSNGMIAKCTVTVTDPITGITLNKTAISMNKGSTYTLVPTITPSTTTDSKKVTWTSSNASVATVDSNGKVTATGNGSVEISATTSNGMIAKCTVIVNVAIPNVQYKTHIEGIGWQAFKKDGLMSGTSGRSLRLEAMTISLLNKPYTGSIRYQTHVEGIGWQGWVDEGQAAGTSGRSLRLEAMKVELVGDIANYYDVYYRVHAQGFGWMGWAKNGASSGTAGYSYRLEAMEIKLVAKGQAAPGTTTNAYRESAIGYRTHVQGVGWQNYMFDGQTSGTTGLSYRLEGIILSLFNQKYAGGLQYQTHIEGIGWQNPVATGGMSGTSGRALRLEAIRINLTGEMANQYDVYYRVHAQGFGWMGWAKNGASSGTAGYAYRLEGIEVVLVPKGSNGPGSVGNAFVQR